MEALPEILLEHVLLYCEAKARCLATAASSTLSKAVLAVDARRTVLALGPSTQGNNFLERSHLLEACAISLQVGEFTSVSQAALVHRMWSRYSGLIELHCDGVANDALVEALTRSCNGQMPTFSTSLHSENSSNREGAAAAAAALSSSSSSSSSLPVVENLPWGHHYTPVSNQPAEPLLPLQPLPPSQSPDFSLARVHEKGAMSASAACGGRLLLPSLRLLSLAHSPNLTRQALCSLLCLRNSLDDSSAGRLFRRSSNEDFVAPRLLFQLETLDLTFCPQITHEATLLFRRALREAAEKAATATCTAIATEHTIESASATSRSATPASAVANAAGDLNVVRLPLWLTGSFITPFGGNGGGNTNDNENGGGSSNDSSRRNNRPEEHTYYCDGSFSFGRGSQANGYVVRLEEAENPASANSSSSGTADATSRTTIDPRMREGVDMGEVRDTLQYIDFEPPLDWPPWTMYMYRPGVALRDLGVPDKDEDEDGDGDSGERKGLRSVLVAQALSGLRAPRLGFPQLLTEEEEDNFNNRQHKHHDLDRALTRMVDSSDEVESETSTTSCNVSNSSSSGSSSSGDDRGSNSSGNAGRKNNTNSNDQENKRRQRQRLKHLQSAARRMVPLGTSLYLLPSGVLLPRYQPLPEEHQAEVGTGEPLQPLPPATTVAATPTGRAATAASSSDSAADASRSSTTTSRMMSSRRRVPWTAESAAAAGAVGMVSRMQVRPLSPKHRMPPRHLEDRIAAFVSQMDEEPFSTPSTALQLETSLHLALGGSVTDANPNSNNDDGIGGDGDEVE